VLRALSLMFTPEPTADPLAPLTGSWSLPSPCWQRHFLLLGHGIENSVTHLELIG